jgi:hypothetical protein
MFMPPRAATSPRGAVQRRAQYGYLFVLIFLLPLALLFVTVRPAAAVDACTTDTAGANDEPGQKDLTRLCIDDAGLPTTLAVKWQWDEIGWTGSNTGDACGLFDTDNDGNADYSLCTIVSGAPAAFEGQQLYRCDDSRPEKCMGAAPVAAASTCTAAVSGDFSSPADPFPSGSAHPYDTVGACTVALADMGDANNGVLPQLLDVCSYPSQQPNSDPSDCVVYRDNTGRLEVRKVLRPATNPGRFNLLIDSSIAASAVGDGGTTGERIVDAGRHTVSETTATNTNLGDYNTWITCRDANGSGSIVAAQANNSPLTLAVPDGSDIVCTIVNERQTGTIYVTKVVNWNGVPVDSNQTFTICVYGPSAPNGSCQTTDYDGGLLTWPAMETGYYAVVERDPGGAWSVEVDTSPVYVPCNGFVSATVTNTRKRGSLEVTKFVNWNGAAPNPAQTFPICITGPSYPAPNCQTADFDGGTLVWADLIPGIYTVTEPDPGSQWAVTLTGSPVKVPPDGAVAKASVANTLKRGSLTVTKVANWNGVTPDQDQAFDLCITGPSYPIGDCRPVGHLGGALSWLDLIPGPYTVGERDAGPLWTTEVQGSPATVVSGGDSATATVINSRKLGGLQVTKTVNWNGAAQDAGQFFHICIAGPSYPEGDCQTTGSSGGTLTWNNLIPGPYTVTENDPGGEWVVAVPPGPVTVPGDGGSVATGVTNTHKRGSLRVEKLVNWNGGTPDANQSFTICIAGPSHPNGNCQVIGAAGGPLTWHDLVPGDYRVTENALGGEWITTVAGSPAAVVGDGSTAEASVTNTRKRGSLTVTKVVEWNGVTPDQEQTFQICISGPSFPNGGCQLADYDGGALVWENLIPGAYRVSEEALGSEWVVTITGAEVTVPPDGSGVSASVVNQRKLGGLNVTKAVDWNGVTPDETQAFAVCIRGASFPAGDCKTADYDGATLTWLGLIPGEYAVYETSPGSEWAVTVDGGGVATVPTNGGTSDATITNTRKRGSLTVAKVVDWNGITPNERETFQVCITGPSFPGGDCKTVDYDGEALRWNDLIPGAYSVSERDPGSAWTVEITGSPAVVPSDGAGAKASVLNTRKLGSLRVTKTVNWNGEPSDSGQSFTICIVGPSYTNGDCKSVGAKGGVLTWNNLLPGTYGVAENNPGRAWDVEIKGSPATVPADGGQAAAAVTNTRLQRARITVTKMLTTTSTSDWAFVFRLSGEGPQTVSSLNPSVTWEDLEPNRTYLLSEDDPEAPWAEGAFTCTIGGSAAGEVREETNLAITLRPGDHAVCAKYNSKLGGESALDQQAEPGSSFELYLPSVRR